MTNCFLAAIYISYRCNGKLIKYKTKHGSHWAVKIKGHILDYVPIVPRYKWYQQICFIGKIRRRKIMTYIYNYKQNVVEVWKGTKFIEKHKVENYYWHNNKLNVKIKDKWHEVLVQ